LPDEAHPVSDDDHRITVKTRDEEVKDSEKAASGLLY
jgi:hypothetical protein